MRFTRRQFTLAAGAAALTPSAAGAHHTALSRRAALAAASSRNDTLAFAAARSRILLGTAVDPEVVASDPAYAKLIARECSLVGCENALKPVVTRPTPNRFDFSRADRLTDFAAKHDLAFRGHTLVWYASIPEWIRDSITGSNAARTEMLSEVSEPCEHFRGRVDSWDVVNEVVDANASTGLRASYWLKMLGPDYIPLAFNRARAADPSALLVLNENHIECDLPAHESKRQALLELLSSLRRDNIPVDALGIEAHLGDPLTAPFNKAVFARFLSSINELGLKVLITELDVSDKFLPADVHERDSAVATVYADFLELVLQSPAVVTVGFWGLSDRHTWISKFYPRIDDLPVRPTLFDNTLRMKPSYAAVYSALQSAKV